MATYSVWILGTDERLDKHGLNFTSAKAFARIGSQEGEPREVVRGTSGEGRKVRIYIDGERAFPLVPVDLEELYRSEWPKEL
jgi:hypothetical protein